MKARQFNQRQYRRDSGVKSSNHGRIREHELNGTAFESSSPIHLGQDVQDDQDETLMNYPVHPVLAF